MNKKDTYIQEIIEICKYNHLSPDDIYFKLKQKFPTIGIATVYRHINQLVDKWILRKVANIKGKIYYETFTTPHFHLIDEDTGQIIDLPADAIKISPSLKEKISHISNINIVWKLKN
jgi:Fe2+ or Zn2+ uptake regulation protein